MRLFFFLLQVTAILSWLNYKYDISLKEMLNSSLELKPSDPSLFSKGTLSPSSTYTSYHELDVIGQKIIVLDEIPVNEKLNAWLSSPLHEEMLSFFPKVERMKYFFNDRVEDNSEFKGNYIAYFEEMHMQYISGEITSKEFKKSLSTLKLKK